MDRPMNAFRYDTSGQWYKGNTHLHSTASDGGMGFAELAELYHSAGYDFLYRTDHWVASDVERDGEKYPLLWLDGVELDGRLITDVRMPILRDWRYVYVEVEDQEGRRTWTNHLFVVDDSANT